MVGASVREDGRNFQLLRHRRERDRVAGGDHAGEPVDALRDLHPSQLFDIAVDAGSLIRRNGHELARTQKSALGIDLIGGKGVPFQGGRAERSAWSRLKRHVTELERRHGNLSFRRHRSCGARRGNAGTCAHRRRHAEAADKAAPVHALVHVGHSLFRAP